MAIDTTDMEAIYDKLAAKGLGSLVQLQKDTQMEDEVMAQVSSSVIVGAMENTIKALEMFKNNELVDVNINLAGQKIVGRKQ